VVIHYEEALYQVYAPLPLPTAEFMASVLRVDYLCLLWFSNTALWLRNSNGKGRRSLAVRPCGLPIR